MKTNRKTRLAIGLIAGFIALTAMAGGLAMLFGADRFPLEWLEGTLFGNYTIPALLLAIVVGGSSLIAAVAILTGRKVGTLAAMAAGLILAGFIVVEVVTLKQVPPGPTAIEVMYFLLGLVIFGLAMYLRRIDANTGNQ